MSLSQYELVWIRVLCKMAESKMAEFKMVAIFKLIRLIYFESGSQWRKSVFEWIWEKITRCLNPRWQNSRWLPSWSWVRMNEWSFFVQMVGTNIGKWGKCEWDWEENLLWLNPRWWNSSWHDFKIGCNHQVESEWMSEVILCKCWELILASVSEFERKN